ncbi:hypothetical protein [Photobacterium leiognathi]|uniref:hypothetical protein n=1 Tax=Photobacterium leiognathi TaxID=553611 RepID=UPI002981A627|nr:hypothetical protein [Photobacterium leiognathi]
MPSFDFDLIAETKNDVKESEVCDLNDELIEAAGNDFVMTVIGRRLVIGFSREANSFDEAVKFAKAQIESVNNIKVIGVE